jgi:hypothetical protein
VLEALDKVGADNAQAVLAAAVEAAKKGDIRAAELILSRTWPSRKGRPLLFELPHLQTSADMPSALGAVAAAAAAGALTIDEANGLVGILEAQRRGIELADLERRLEALETKAPQAG